MTTIIKPKTEPTLAQKYANYVAASLVVERGRFQQAEGLATDIPYRPQGSNAHSKKRTVLELCAEANEAAVQAGGDSVEASTLDDWRKTALWLQESGGTSRFKWVPGVSFTAHNEARKAGKTYDEFVAMPVKKSRNSRPSKQDIPLRPQTPEEKVETVQKLLADPDVSPDTVAELIEAEMAKPVVKTAVRKRKTVARKARREALEDVIKSLEERFKDDSLVSDLANTANRYVLKCEDVPAWMEKMAVAEFDAEGNYGMYMLDLLDEKLEAIQIATELAKGTGTSELEAIANAGHEDNKEAL